MSFMQNGGQGNTKKALKAELVLAVVGAVLTVIVIVLAILQISGTYKHAINICEPLMGVVMILQGIRSWKRNKVMSVISFAAALFIFAVAVTVLL